jgi:hypothetical protein
MSELADLLRRCNRDTLVGEAIGLGALCSLILLGLFLPGLG